MTFVSFSGTGSALRAFAPALAGLCVCAAVTFALPRTENETRWKQAGQSEAISRRLVFFGHQELSDVLLGLSILAASVDAFQNAAAIKETPDSPVRKRLASALEAVPTLAARRIGMSEVYTLPAMYLLFEEDDLAGAYAIVREGLADDRVHAQVPLLAGFIAHAFLRDLPAAANAYTILGRRPGVPDWVRELAGRLTVGDDPYTFDPRAKRTLCGVIAKSFPKASRYLKERTATCGGN